MAKLRSLSLCALTGVLLSASALLAQRISPAVRITTPIDDNQRITLPHTVSPLANAANDRGRAPDSMPLTRMSLVLQRSASQEAALRELINEMHTPGSPNYHKWLTPEQFGEQFGASDQDIATIESWLSGEGFSVTGVTPGRQTIEFSGTVAQLRNTFHTQIHSYQVAGRTHFANASDPQIPAALAPVVAGFTSLNDFPIRRYSHLLGKASFNPQTHESTPQWTTGNGTTTNRYVMAPGDYAVQYDLNPLYNASVNGSGQTIAIINDSNINVAVVNRFRTLFGLSANPPQVVIDGNDPGVDGINNPDGPNYDSIEAYLDVEWAGAVAPSANIDLVIAADTQLDSGLILAAQHAVYSNLAPVISVSFGACEADLGSSNAFLNSLWEQAAAQGITVVVSSGDDGSAACDNDDTQSYAISGQQVSGFASTPFNVAVGGTDFYYSDYATGGASLANYWNTTPSNSTPTVSIKGVIPEQPWNNSQYGDNIRASSAGSGGIVAASGGASNSALCSTNTYNSNTGLCTGTLSGYPKPAWQLLSIPGMPNDKVRDLPDVSLFAANGANLSYVPICAEDGDCQPVSSGNTVQITGVGGTSASAPSFAGVMALINQKYGRQGQADTVLYPLYAQYPAAFHDVTAGSIAVPCEYAPTLTANCIAVTNPVIIGTVTEGEIGTGTTPEYNAAAGYDLASGLGSIDANVLVNDWNKVSLASTTTTMTPSQTSFTHGTAITLTGTVTAGSGTPTGDVALMTDAPDPVNQSETFFTLNNGSYTSATFYPSGVNFLPGGTYHIWGQYGGDASNGMSTSAKTLVTVNPENSGVFFNVLTPSSNGVSTITSGTTKIAYGTQLTLSALPAPSAQLTAFENCVTGASSSCPIFTYPTGTVLFKDGSTTLNTAAVNSDGEAEYTPPAAFSAGTHTVSASYSGDNSYNASTSSSITFSVVATTPTVFLTAPLSSYTAGQSSVLTVLVEGYGVGAAPTGSITLTGVPSGTPTTATLSAGVDPNYGTTVGIATVTIPATAAVGTYSIKAAYTPDSNSSANYGSSTSSAVSLQITAASGTATTTTVNASASTTSPTAAVTVTGTVTAASGAAPAGTVYLLAGVLNTANSGNSVTEVAIASAGLVTGTGSSSTFSLTLNSQSLLQGSNQLTVYYLPATSSPDAPSSTVLTISNTLADFSLTTNGPIVTTSVGGTATDTINIASVNGFSGTVSLTCAVTPASAGVTCSLPSPASLTSGSSTAATLTLTASSSATAGNYNVLITGQDSTGAYVHTLNLSAPVTVIPFSLAPSSGSISIKAGATSGNTATITVTPASGGYSGTVNLSCSISPAAANDPATCSLSPASVTLSGTTAQISTLTISTTAATSAYNKPLPVFWPTAGGAVLALLFCFGVPRRRRNWLLMTTLLILFVSLAGFGCGGGGGSSSNNNNNGNSGTTAGTYTVTVKGQSSTGTASTQVTLTVN